MTIDSMKMRTDPVQLEIMIQRFRSITEEMGYALQRTGYTAFVNETADLGVALVTREGEIFGYPHSIGITMFSNLHFGTLIEMIGETRDGDIFITNDPYTTGGLSSHLPDISLLKPIYANGELVCFAYTYVHSTDVGGKVAGSLSPSSYEIYQEGIRIPPTKLYDGGELNQAFLNIFLANCRIPKDNWGDMRAMTSALKVGERRIRELVSRVGNETLTHAMHDVVDYSEQRARRAIERIPDGTYDFWDYLDDDVATEIPIKFCVKVTVRGNSLHIDFTGTDPQVRSAFNIYSRGGPHPWLIYKVAFLLLTMEPDIPVNAGLLRPVSVTAPEGSIVNCTPPAAVGLRTTAGVRLQDAISGAFARALPDVMPAAGAGYMAPIVMAEPNESGDGVKVNVLEPLVGGTGASSAGDGLNSRDVVDIANLRNSPLEVMEGSASALVKSYRLLPDSGGAGKFRGGLGVEFEFTALAPQSLITARGQERHRFRPWGLRGGKCGSGAVVYLKRAGEAEYKVYGKVDSLELFEGDVVRVETPGGGGYGHPFERDAGRVLADVLDGFVTQKAAETIYGVVVGDGKVDEPATGTLRKEMKAKAEPSDVTYDEARIEYEALWTPEVWEAYTDVLYGLPVGSRSSARGKLWRKLESMRGGKVTPETVRNAWEELSALRRPGSPAEAIRKQTAAA